MWLIYQKIVGLIPGQGTYPGYGFSPWSGGVYERQPINISLTFLSLSPLPFLSLYSQ